MITSNLSYYSVTAVQLFLTIILLLPIYLLQYYYCCPLICYYTITPVYLFLTIILLLTIYLSHPQNPPPPPPVLFCPSCLALSHTTIIPVFSRIFIGTHKLHLSGSYDFDEFSSYNCRINDIKLPSPKSNRRSV